LGISFELESRGRRAKVEYEKPLGYHSFLAKALPGGYATHLNLEEILRGTIDLLKGLLA
jgi:hypothetical protein